MTGEGKEGRKGERGEGKKKRRERMCYGMGGKKRAMSLQKIGQLYQGYLGILRP